jgi:hypothetical protein
MSKLTLTEVLFSPEVGYILVSIGYLNQMGCISTFGDSKCTIHDAGSEQVDNIPQSNKEIYKVMHDNEDVANPTETVMYNRLSKWMGHFPQCSQAAFKNGNGDQNN